MSRVGVKVAIRTRPTAAFDQDEIFVDAPNAVSTKGYIISMTD